MVLLTRDHQNDITTLIRLVRGTEIEVSMGMFDVSIEEGLATAARDALRVAVNLCLLMVNFGHKSKYILEGERARDSSLARKGNVEARKRVRLAVQQLFIDQEVKLFSVAGPSVDRGGTHASPKPHWRKGHWRSRPVYKEKGPIFVAPIFVRGSEFVGHVEDTTVVYK
jgi:hypothetical protein